MSSCLSPHRCWFPRTVCFQRIIFRSTLSTTSDRSLSTHAHYSKRETDDDMQELARKFSSLT
jgi:hypothetical protein